MAKRDTTWAIDQVSAVVKGKLNVPATTIIRDPGGGSGDTGVYLRADGTRDGATYSAQDFSQGLNAGSSTTSYLAIDSEGRLTLEGAATVYDDLRVPMTSTKLGGSKDPGFAQVRNTDSSQGVFAHLFDKATEEELYFSVQLPHAWKEESDIEPHVHWMPTDTGTGSVVWGLEYVWANMDDAFGNTTITTASDAGAGTAYTHQYCSLGEIDGDGFSASSMILCRVYRDAGNAADTYDADAALLEIDFHYEIDKLGDSSLGSG